MKKLITAVVLISLLLIVLTVGSCVTHEPTVHTLKYLADEGGSIDGQAEQEVRHEQDGAAVTAVADEGYEFLKWSDDVTTATRQDKCVREDITVTALFKKAEKTNKSYTVTYLVEEGGTLEGEAVQTISKEDDGTKSVIVNVQDGYEFLGWSDGRDLIWRSDAYYNIDTYYKEDTTFIARIRRIDDYKLMDWYSEFGVGVPTIEITEKTYDNLSFPIPTREHFTFEGWYLGDTLVADAQGESYFTKELLQDGERSITAKWTPNQTFTYKILLVYVTRIDANLLSSDDTKIHVDYTISDLEREFYHWTTIRLKQYLDEMVDGLIDFQVDEYYTTKTVVAEDFKHMGKGKGGNYLHPDQIPEVKNLVTEYDSALSVFSINDKDYKLHEGGLAGSADQRYGQIYFDTFLSALDVYKFTLGQVLDLLKDCKIADMLVGTLYDVSYVTGEYWFYTFAHELAHTIELRINGDDFHNIEGELGLKQNMGGYDPLKYYYLQAVLQDGKNVGIPYAFWSGNIMKVRYDRTEGGHITGEGNYTGDFIGATHRIYDVPYGYDVPSVTAIPYNGYEFAEWSDGVKTATRTDLNITESMTVTAIFKPITYELTVVAGEGGRLTLGEGTWSLQPHKSESMKAVANEGYKFVGWSDGNVENFRSFTLNYYELSLFDENRQYTLTAIFVKIDEESNYYVLNLIQAEGGLYSVYSGLETKKSVLMEKNVDTIQVYAWENQGYRFVSWSDGNTEQRRTFTIDSDLIALSNEDNVITIYAIFEKVEE